MVITLEPIVSSPSKITSVSPSLVAISVDESVPVPDNKVELEILVELSDGDSDEVVCFRSLCSVMILKTFLSAGISAVDIVVYNPVYHIDLGA